MASNDQIAGTLTSDDWHKQKALLNKDPSEARWDATFNDFLKKRLNLRYLKPIKLLQSELSFQGEGFTIVSVQCALIEFLAALKVGENYRFLKNGETLKPYEYSGSKKLFCNFLQTEAPFKEWFKTPSDAEEFYSNVRCALLHEARTKSGWRIWATRGEGVDPQSKHVRRDELQTGILQYIEQYGLLLAKDKSVQEAFIRKFDHLAST